MNDIHTGGSQSDIDRMMGSVDKYSKFTSKIPRLLDNEGLKLKTLVQGG